MGALVPGRDGHIGRYLRRNDRVWTPPALITFDTETRRTERRDGEDQALRLWCARLDDRRQPRRGPVLNVTAQGHTGMQLAEQIGEWTKRRENVWLYAHNLGYDLFTSQLVQCMAAIGWSVQHCSTMPEYLFLTLALGRNRITLSDLHHLLPMRLADVGSLLGLPKATMPHQDAPDDEWFAYCGRDVDVLAEAVLALMGHWDDYALGNWSLSGAGCGFRAMRHTLPAKSVTLIEDKDASENERNAIYGGRRYCWRHGEQPPGRYSELDFTAAHATVAANHPMPVKRGNWFNTLDPNHMAVDGKYAIVIAECEVETDVPRFPCRVGGRVWYPVGRFRTVLASPEIAWARDLGCLRSIGRGQFHYTSTAMAPFFRRVLDIGNPRNDQHSAIVRAMWKQWGRSVIGKFAQRGYEIKPTPLLTDKVWHYERAIDAETMQEYWLVHFGGRVHEARPKGDGSNAYPAVLALVESYERVAIGTAAEMLGDQVVIQCDTDGLWADVGQLENGAATGLGFDLADVTREARIPLAVDVVNHQLEALQLREKHTVARIAMYGPQNYDAGPYTKHSGRPGGLREVQPGLWAGDTFPAVARQMAVSEPGVYRTELVTWSRPANVIPGWVIAGGSVRPVEARIGQAGCTELLPYSESRHAARGDQLAHVQHPALAALWDQAAPYVETPNGKQTIWQQTSHQAQDRLTTDRRRARHAGRTAQPYQARLGAMPADELMAEPAAGVTQSRTR